MIFMIDMGYGCRDIFEKMSDEDYANLRKACMFLPEERSNAWYTCDNRMVDEEGLKALFDAGITHIILKNFKNTYSPHGVTLTNVEGHPTSPMAPASHFHIPNVGLLSVRHVTVLEDCCTDNLQDHLNDGWSIVAVCPPNGARRPDYVIGKS